MERLDQLGKQYLTTRYRSTLKIKRDPRYISRIRVQANELAVYQLRYTELRTLLLTAFEVPELDDSIIVDGIIYNTIGAYIRSLVMELRNIVSHMGRRGVNTADLIEPIQQDLERYNHFF